MKKKILIITYNFPPFHSAGVHRIIGFMRYLPTFGFNPIILTAHNATGILLNNKLIENLPYVPVVHRTFSFEIETIKKNLINIIRKKRSPIKKNNLSKKPEKFIKKSRVVLDLMAKIENCFFIPDNKIGWLPSAFIKGFNIICSEKIDIIFTSSPPNSVHLIGLILKIVTKKKWVIDLRDPWENPFLNNSSFIKSINNFIGCCIIKNADYIIANTNTMRQNIIKKYSLINCRKIIVIHNGYEIEDFKKYSHVKKPDKQENDFLNITFVGTVYPGMIKNFCYALTELKNEGYSLFNRIKFNIVGKLFESEMAIIQERELNETINYIGFVSHEDSLDYMFRANVLLILLPDQNKQKGCIPSKIFNYLMMNKPILGLVPNGDAANLIRETNTGIIVDPGKIANIKFVLKDLMEKFINNTLTINPNWEEIKKYERKLLTKTLAGIFNNL